MSIEIKNKVRQIKAITELQKTIRESLRYFRKELPIEFEYHKLPKNVVKRFYKNFSRSDLFQTTIQELRTVVNDYFKVESEPELESKSIIENSVPTKIESPERLNDLIISKADKSINTVEAELESNINSKDLLPSIDNNQDSKVPEITLNETLMLLGLKPLNNLNKDLSVTDYSETDQWLKTLVEKIDSKSLDKKLLNIFLANYQSMPIKPEINSIQSITIKKINDLFQKTSKIVN